MEKYVLHVKDLIYEYPDKTVALNNINFKIEKGKKVFFHGRNGAGKTTLFQCLCGLFKIKKGEVFINGNLYKKEKDRMKYISIVFQNANDQIIGGSVFEEVAFGPINMGLNKDEVIERVSKSLKLMDIENLKDKPPHFLSYGQKKRVSIASILSMNPDIIILDEPTAGLDMEQTRQLIKILNNLAKIGTTLLISTHDVDFSFSCADKIIVMEEGQIIGNDFPNEIFSNQEILNKSGLEKPLIIDVFNELLRYNYCNSKEIPKSKEELFYLIRQGDKRYEG